MTRTNSPSRPSIPVTGSESSTTPANQNPPRASTSTQASQVSAQLQDLQPLSRSSSTSGSFKSARTHISASTHGSSGHTRTSSQEVRGNESEHEAEHSDHLSDSQSTHSRISAHPGTSHPVNVTLPQGQRRPPSAQSGVLPPQVLTRASSPARTVSSASTSFKSTFEEMPASHGVSSTAAADAASVHSQPAVQEHPVNSQQLEEVDQMDEQSESIADSIGEAIIAAEERAMSEVSPEGSQSRTSSLAEPPTKSSTGNTPVPSGAATPEGAPVRSREPSVHDGEQIHTDSADVTLRASISSRAPTPPDLGAITNEPPTNERSPSRTSISRHSEASDHISVERPHTPPVTTSPTPATTHAVLGNREVNNISHLRNTLPNDVHGCVSTLLSPVRSQFSASGFDALVRTQTATLQSRHIHTKDQLVDVLQAITRKDNLMRLAQGAVGGTHFNAPGIATSYGPEPTQLVLKNAASTNAVQGAVGGLIAGLSDATSTPAKAKTFTDAYYKRPAVDHLPPEMHSVNKQTGAQALKETNISWVGAFGASYAVRGTARFIATQTAGPAMGAALDTALSTPVNVAAGIGATFIQHKIDERKGRSGVPFFIARTNLGECIDAARKPMHAYAGSAVAGAARHAANVVTEAPAGVKAALTDPALLASTATLGAVLTVPFTAAGEVQKSLAKNPKTADFLGSLTKYAALEGAWAVWSTAYASVSHLHANRQVPTGSVPTTGDVEEQA
jgi:hypothetical protein